MAKRFDKIELNNLKKGDNGFLTYDLIAAQTGVFPYYDLKQGRVVMELKHPDDLLTDSVRDQLNNLPITEDHPEELVNSANSNKYVKGMTHDKSIIIDNKLENSATVFDEALADKIMNGSKKECSLGFECDVIDEAGEFMGIKYERRQKDIRLNHLAMVPKARCGPECTIKLDSNDDAVQIRHDEIDKYKTRRDEEDMKMIKIKLDGTEFEVPEIVGNRVETLEQKTEELTKQVGQLEGTVDGKDDEIKNLKDKIEELEKNQLSEEDVDTAIQEKLDLVQNAAPMLADSYDFKGKSIRQIKVDCIKSVSGDEFKEDGKSDEYINARFDAICEFVNKQEYTSRGDNSLKFKGDSNSAEINTIRAKRLNLKK